MVYFLALRIKIRFLICNPIIANSEKAKTIIGIGERTISKAPIPKVSIIRETTIAIPEIIITRLVSLMLPLRSCNFKLFIAFVLSCGVDVRFVLL